MVFDCISFYFLITSSKRLIICCIIPTFEPSIYIVAYILQVTFFFYTFNICLPSFSIVLLKEKETRCNEMSIFKLFLSWMSVRCRRCYLFFNSTKKVACYYASGLVLKIEIRFFFRTCAIFRLGGRLNIHGKISAEIPIVSRRSQKNFWCPLQTSARKPSLTQLTSYTCHRLGCQGTLQFTTSYLGSFPLLDSILFLFQYKFCT